MTRRGWCPGLFTPMPSGDGLLLRVTATQGRLTAAQARHVAASAARHGNGIIELTSRGKLQIRGLTQASAAAFAAGMLDVGLGGVGGPDLSTPPLAGDDPTMAPDTLALAEAIATSLRELGLPDKFHVAIDGGGVLPLAIAADIMVRADAGAWLIGLAGSPLAARSDATRVAPAVTRLSQAVLAADARRMADLVRADTAERLFASCGLRPDRPMQQPAAVDPIGVLRHAGAFGLAPPFGQTDAAGLSRLADLSERFGDATLRLTPWRAVLLANLDAGRHPDARHYPDARDCTGFITDPGDPRRQVTACTGQPRCAAASVDARADAAAVAAALPGVPVHVSGCAKGCAHPGPAPLTLVGSAGRYGLVRAGRAGDPPEAAGLTIAQAIQRCAA
jgi:precorrin-3B synthase